MPKRWAAPVKDEMGDGARLKEERVIKKIKVKEDVKEEEPDAQWWWHNKEGVKEEKEQQSFFIARSKSQGKGPPISTMEERASLWMESAVREMRRTGDHSLENLVRCCSNKEGVKEEKEQTPSRQEIENKWIEWAQRQKQRTGNPSSSTSPSS